MASKMTLPTLACTASLLVVQAQSLPAGSPPPNADQGAVDGRKGQVGLRASAPESADSDVEPETLVDIDGSQDPDRLPETMVWGEVFHVLHRFTRGKTDPQDPDVREFAAANLFMSSDDLSVLLPEVARALERIRSAKGRLGEEGADQAARREARRALRRGILADRDRILARLSPRGAKALLRYVALLRQGSHVSITPEALAEELEAQSEVESR